jgi:MFS family permease
VRFDERRQSWLVEMTAGFRQVRRQEQLRVAACSAAIAMFASGLLVAAQFSLVDALGRSASFLGVITGALGAGSIVAGLLSARVISRYGEVTLLMLRLGDSAVGYLLLATGWLPGILSGAVLLGFALPWSVIALINLGQRVTPVDLQGRVAAATGLLLFAPQPLAQLAGAAAIRTTDYRVLYLIVAGVALLNLIAVRLRVRIAARS